MKRPTLIQGIGVALLLSIISLPLAAFFSMLFGYYTAAALLIAGMAYIYIVYLLSRSGVRIGRGTIAFVSAVVLFAAVLAGVQPFFLAVLAVGLIWCVRSLYAYSSIVSALIDGLLCFFSLAAGVWVFALSSSAMAAFWTFFLVQALFVFIPKRISAGEGAEVESKSLRAPEVDSFQQAYKAAEAALAEI